MRRRVHEGRPMALRGTGSTKEAVVERLSNVTSDHGGERTKQEGSGGSKGAKAARSARRCARDRGRCEGRDEEKIA